MGAERQLAAVMFTDMEGFTALMQSDEQLALAKRDKYTSVAQERHEAYGGVIVQFFGDGSLSTFANPVDAVACAISVQQALQAPLEVPVRIGIHVGNVMVEPTGLVGDAVNIASRIESFGFPGAVLVSDSVYDQVSHQPTFAFVDLGKFKHKNVGRPFTIYAIAVDGLVVPAPDFLHGKGEQLATLPANLPDPGPPLVGREADLAALTDLVSGHRVVTITGPGGTGKTRTAIEVCRRLGPEFLDGISFVSLADVTDSADVVPTLADALDVKEAEGRRLGEAVTALIGDKKALLVLDNLEQVIEAASTVADLVATCPELRLVVTSRTPLRIGAEREYQLAPWTAAARDRHVECWSETRMEMTQIGLFYDRRVSLLGGWSRRSKDLTDLARREAGRPCHRDRVNYPTFTTGPGQGSNVAVDTPPLACDRPRLGLVIEPLGQFVGVVEYHLDRAGHRHHPQELLAGRQGVDDKVDALRGGHSISSTRRFISSDQHHQIVRAYAGRPRTAFSSSPRSDLALEKGGVLTSAPQVHR